MVPVAVFGHSSVVVIVYGKDPLSVYRIVNVPLLTCLLNLAGNPVTFAPVPPPLMADVIVLIAALMHLV
jgi:hypothetical protein